MTQERNVTQNIERKVTDMSGLSALPRSNSELVFKNPWEGRAFGVAVTLPHAGRYQWREFNNVFIEHISRAEQTGNSSTYYHAGWPLLNNWPFKRALFPLMNRRNSLYSWQRKIITTD